MLEWKLGPKNSEGSGLGRSSRVEVLEGTIRVVDICSVYIFNVITTICTLNKMPLYVAACLLPEEE